MLYTSLLSMNVTLIIHDYDIDCAQKVQCGNIRLHCKKFLIVLTNKYGYLSCIFVFSIPGTEQQNV